MAINKLMRATLRAISYPDINSKKHYKTERLVVNLAHKHYLRPFYRIWDHKVLVENHEIPVRVFAPKMKGKFPVLLFFHGGGWVTGSIDSYDKVCSNMAQITNHIVVSVDYRLAPEYPFPIGLEDCYTVAKELFLNSDIFRISPEEITLIGDSAGGNIAAVVSLMARDRGDFSPKKQILLYPATYNDHSESAPFPSIIENGTDFILTSRRIRDYMDLYIQNKQQDWNNPYFAPLLAEDLSNQPNTLILTAEYDPLRDEGEAYGKKLRKFGNNVEIHRLADALHGFISLSPSFPHVKKSYAYINRFLQHFI